MLDYLMAAKLASLQVALLVALTASMKAAKKEKRRGFRLAAWMVQKMAGMTVYTSESLTVDSREFVMVLLKAEPMDPSRVAHLADSLDEKQAGLKDFATGDLSAVERAAEKAAWWDETLVDERVVAKAVM